MSGSTARLGVAGRADHGAKPAIRTRSTISGPACSLPGKTPPAIRNRLHAEIAKALRARRLSERLQKLGADPMLLTPAQFDALVNEEIEVNTQLVKAAKIEVN